MGYLLPRNPLQTFELQPYPIQPPQASNLQTLPPVSSDISILVSSTTVASGLSGASTLNMLATTSLKFLTIAVQSPKRGMQVKETLEKDEQLAQK
jgi:hypothetical protein